MAIYKQCTHLKKRLKITQFGMAHFTKVNELKLTQVELLSFFLTTVFELHNGALWNDLLNE